MKLIIAAIVLAALWAWTATEPRHEKPAFEVEQTSHAIYGNGEFCVQHGQMLACYERNER